MLGIFPTYLVVRYVPLYLNLSPDRFCMSYEIVKLPSGLQLLCFLFRGHTVQSDIAI